MPRRRPRKVFDLIGRADELEYLGALLVGGQRRGEPLRCLMFDGPSGVGKTLFAQTLLKISGLEVQFHKLPPKPTRQQVRRVLLQVQASDFVFCDEAHLLKYAEDAQHDIMEALDLGSLAPLDTEKNANKTRLNEGGRIEIPHFTLILATNQRGGLLPALLTRVEHCEYLPPYAEEEMKQIIPSIAARQSQPVLLSQETINGLASISWGIARTAENHVRKLVNYALGTKKWDPTSGKPLGVEVFRTYLAASGTDVMGFGRKEHECLRLLERHGGIALERLAGLLQCDTDSAVEMEYRLLQAGLVSIERSRGRVLTEAGRAHLSNLQELSHRRRPR